MIHRTKLVGLLAAVLSLVLFFIPVLNDPILGISRYVWHLYLFIHDVSVYKVFVGGMIAALLSLFCFLNLFMYRRPKNQALISMCTLAVSLILLGFIYYKYTIMVRDDFSGFHPRLYFGAAIPVVIAMLMGVEFIEARKRAKQTDNQ
jgi:hypothetical protein